jgi:hypothetical protein
VAIRAQRSECVRGERVICAQEGCECVQGARVICAQGCA